MAVQLLGTGGIAALLLLGEAMSMPAAVDVALILALFAAFVSVAFAKGVARTKVDRA
jgi:multicomponent Na+:H+ antiporter subunit F